MRPAPSPFSLAIAAVSLLLTLVAATGIWESYYPDADAAGLRARREHFEKVLRGANVSWKEGLYYKVMDGSPPRARP